MPSHFLLKDGSIKTSNALSPSISVPIGNQVTTNSQGVVVEAVNDYKGASLSGAQEWEQSWTIEPEQDPTVLRRLRALYRFVLGQIDQDQLWSQFAQPRPAALGASTSGLQDLVPSVQLCPHGGSDYPQCLIWSAFADSCSARQGDVPTATRADGEWVCLGRFGSARDRLLRRRTLLIWKPAYDRGMLFDLVVTALQVERDARTGGSRSEPH